MFLFMCLSIYWGMYYCASDVADLIRRAAPEGHNALRPFRQQYHIAAVAVIQG